MLLINFDQTIPDSKRDPALLEKLKREGSGILNWMLDGFHDYQKNGLKIPQAISAATDAYKNEQDLIGEWIHDHCKIVTASRTLKTDCYRAYQVWTKRNGQYPLAQRRFTTRLVDKGYKLDGGRRNIMGLELNNEGQQDAKSFF